MNDSPPPRPRRLVLLGHPLGHTLSPILHGAAMRASGIDVAYRALDVPQQDLDATLDALVRDGAGGNVTIPHKVAVARRCTRLTHVAERAGAVNTFWCDGETLVGDNTDVGGFDRAARALLRDELPTRIAVLGAGGAAAGVLAALEAWPNARVRVWNRSAERAASLAARFTNAFPGGFDDVLSDAELVVNATSIGLRDDAMPTEMRALPRRAAVIDLVYRRGETPWVRTARLHGHRAMDGLAMLVEQAALAQERWFGGVADRAAMWAALDAHVG